MKALVVVDIQNDFLPGGSLAVPGGDAIVPIINRLIGKFSLVVATQDWHPPGHLSFASSHPGNKPFDTIDLDGLEQVLWPDHCVWNSPGAEFSQELNLGPVAAIFRKGMNPRVDSYSAIYDNGHRRKTGLAEWLRGMRVDEVYLAGLAADYCVAYTARDAIGEGFKVAVIEDATRAISEDNLAKVKQELDEKGVRFLSSEEVEASIKLT